MIDQQEWESNWARWSKGGASVSGMEACGTLDSNTEVVNSRHCCLANLANMQSTEHSFKILEYMGRQDSGGLLDPCTCLVLVGLTEPRIRQSACTLAFCGCWNLTVATTQLRTRPSEPPSLTRSYQGRESLLTDP